MRATTFLVILLVLCCKTVSAESEKFSAWYYDCLKPDTCKIYTYYKIPKKVADDPTLHAFVLAVHSDSSIIFEEVWDIQFQREVSTNKLPVIYAISNYKVVRNTNPTRFNEGRPIHLKVGDEVVDSDPCRTSCRFSANQKLFNMLIAATKADVYVTFKDWKTGEPYEKKLATFSLIGFTKAYKSLGLETISERTTQETVEISPESAINLVSKNIIKNKLGVKDTDLVAKKNMKGSGYFVYAKKTEYHGVKRYVVWYVADDKAMKLNSPSSQVTPGLPWSREIFEDSVWNRAGFSRFDATSEALSQVFGKNP